MHFIVRVFQMTTLPLSGVHIVQLVYLKQTKWTPSRVIARLGKEINDPTSVYYWCWRNDIPVYCPALTDGSLGDMLYFHSYKNPGLVIDIVEDIRSINNQAVHAKRTGIIILGGGMVKHHICNANLMVRTIVSSVLSRYITRLTIITPSFPAKRCRLRAIHQYWPRIRW